MYEKRDAEFNEWLEEGGVPLPEEPADQEPAEKALRLAFNAGWSARKRQEYLQCIRTMTTSSP